MCVAAVYHSYAKDSAKFEAMFAHSWYKLTTRDMGPATRCTGDLKPPAQPWQYPLPPPPPPGRLPNFMEVAATIEAILSVANPVLPPDYYDGVPNYGPLFVRLAWQCASTFRATDYLGGCNGKLVV
jgi:catalase-peroxidase